MNFASNFVLFLQRCGEKILQGNLIASVQAIHRLLNHQVALGNLNRFADVVGYSGKVITHDAKFPSHG